MIIKLNQSSDCLKNSNEDNNVELLKETRVERVWRVFHIVDLHVHCFPEVDLGLEPDEIGWNKGVPIIVDAGSVGCDEFFQFEKWAKKSKTEVYSWINYSSQGLKNNKLELSSWSFIDEIKLEQIVKNNPHRIKGIKLRASSSVVGDLGIGVIKNGIQFARRMNLPVMIHIGNYPPSIDEILNLVQEGDVITHCFHGKEGGLLEGGKVKDLVWEKRKEGVLFDIGHGSASFDLEVAKQAIEQGFLPDIISSDLHARNYKKILHSLSDVCAKLYRLGMPEAKIIEAITRNPAKVLKIGESQYLEKGRINVVRISQDGEFLIENQIDEEEGNESDGNQ